jgi:hypothetical protein
MIRLALAFALLTASGSGLAAPTDDEADMRCFIVSAEMADSKDKEEETAGSIMLFYYLGKLDGRNPSADLKALLTKEAERMTEAEKQQILASCSSKVEQRGKDLASIGD